MIGQQTVRAPLPLSRTVAKTENTLPIVRETGLAILGEGTKAQVKEKAKREAIRLARERHAQRKCDSGYPARGRMVASMVEPATRRAMRRSYSDWRLSQNWGVVPK